MADQPICITCGLSFGHKYPAFREKRNKLIKPEKTEKFYDFEELELDSILTELGITKICCRMHFMSNVNFIEQKYGYYPAKLAVNVV